MTKTNDDSDGNAAIAKQPLLPPPLPPPSSPHPLPSPTFIPSTAPHPAPATVITAGGPTLGSLDLSSEPAPVPPAASLSSSHPSRHLSSSVFSPTYQPAAGTGSGSPPSGFSLSAASGSSPAAQRRRLELLPAGSQWVNSEADYVPLIPIVLIALLTAYVLYLCLPTRAQFLAAFSSSPSTLTPFHQWAAPHYSPPLPLPSLASSPEFLGRKQQLSALHSLLSSSHTVTVVGSAGIGKTALLRQYIAQTAVSSSSTVSPPYNVVLQLSAASEEALQADLALLHATLQLPLLAPSAAGIRASIVSFLGQFARYLVVFDDCRLPRSVLSAYLPRRGGRESEGLIGDVIYVQESHRRDGSGGSVVNVAAMSRSHALRLLGDVSGRPVNNDTEEQADVLAQALDRTPQALVLAALYAREEAVGWQQVTAAVREMLPSSASPTQAMVRSVLALPAFASSLPALASLSLLTNLTSALPLIVIPASFPLSLYARYGLLHAPQLSFPYSSLHHLLFSSTEQKADTVYLLKELIRAVRQEAKTEQMVEAEALRVEQLLPDSGLVDALVVAAVASFLHSPFHAEMLLQMPVGAPALPTRPFPSLPAPSLSSFYLLHGASASSSSLLQAVFGSSSELSAFDFSFAQAAALLPPLLSLTLPLTALYSSTSLRVSAAADERISLQPVSLPASSPAFTALPLLLVLACYLADVQRDYAASGRVLVTASALALQAEREDEVSAAALLLLAVNHLQRGDHVTALSLLSFLHQRHLQPDSAQPPLPAALQADILSALAIGYMRAENKAEEAETAFTAAMSTRQQTQDRTAAVHLLTCRDLLALNARLRPSASSLPSSLAAQSACEHIENSVFPSPSYAAAARQLSLALLQRPHNLSLAVAHFDSAIAMLSALHAATPDPRLVLSLVHLVHTLSTPSFSPSPPSPPLPVLERFFSVLASSHPRGLGLYALPCLQVAAASLAGGGLWVQGMDVVRQGYEVVRGEGADDEVWRRLYSWMFTQAEREKAEERRREEERERERKRLEAEQLQRETETQHPEL